jgi:predicted glutamine amidotransferase
MCRLLGIVSSRPVDFRMLLAERPRSLAALGEEHRDGWGLAAFSRGRWRIHKGTRPASRDTRFRARALDLHGELLVSHVRKRTVGATRTANSHPFRSGRWVFAHNGTVEDRAWVAEQVSPARAAEIRGDTDSELFFAFLLTRLDEAGLANAPTSSATDDLVARVATECRARDRFGSLNFLLSDGESCYAHRFGRGLYVLERGAGDVRRAHAIFVASEAMTDEPWREVPNETLLRIGRAGEALEITSPRSPPR